MVGSPGRTNSKLIGAFYAGQGGAQEQEQRLKQGDLRESFEVSVSGDQFRAAALRHRVEQRIGHRQVMSNANGSGGESDLLIHGNDCAAERFRDKKVRDCVRLSLKKNLLNLIQHKRRNQDGLLAFQIGREKVGFRVGGDVFEPA
jgi:hypothetical protein